ncbi:uncharacterized protein [Miscanthus floridulus]|uniref:uncharacterized protein n=1 Tax=Miscanthus floridulus TaxID=154761 RepID=UPI00345B1C9E
MSWPCRLAAAPRAREQKPVDGAAPPHFVSLYLSNQAELDFGLRNEWRRGRPQAGERRRVRLDDLRDCVLNVLQILGARLDRPAVAPAVRAWRATADAEIPFPWNTGFIGRERELLDVEAMLCGGAPAHDKVAGKRSMPLDGSITGASFLHGVVCISAASSAGKTELVLEFAHRHAHVYKKVLWVHGEARYLRQSYLKLADHLGIAVGDNSEDLAVLTDIQAKVCGVPLGLALVGSILSEIAVSPAELREMIRDEPHRAPTWSPKDDAAVRDNPGLVQLLDACFTLLHWETPAGLGKVAERLLEASSFFAPVPIPTAMLIHAACACVAEKTPWKRLTRELWRCCTSPRAPLEIGRVEQNALAMLLRLGIAWWSTRAGCVSVHGVFRTFGRKIGSGRVARAVVETIAEQGGGAAQHADDHTWATCLSLFRFEAPDMSVELPPPELARFITRSALPLVARCVTGYSAHGAALELLREATDVVLQAEDLYIGVPRRINDRKYVAIDQKVYRELVQARAELLVMRARIMLRARERAIA